MLYRVSEGDYQKDKYHRFIGAVQSTFNPGMISRGSGVMISPNLVLTTAHNIFIQSWKKYIKDLSFYPGLNGKVNVMCESEQLKIHQAYAKGSTKIGHDFGLIKLKKRLPTFNKQSQLILGINFSDKEATLSLFGYPNKSYTFDKDGQVQEGYQQGFEQQGVIEKIEENKLLHSIDTLPGLGGCPIITGPHKNIIVGIHKGREKKHNIGLAVKLTMDIVLQLQAWRQELNGDKFKVIDLKTGKQIDVSFILNESRKQSVKIPQNIQQITTQKQQFQSSEYLKKEMFEDLQKLIMENKNLFNVAQQLNTKLQKQQEKNEQLNRQLQFEKKQNVKKDQMIQSLKNQLKQAQTISKAKEQINKTKQFLKKVSSRQQEEKSKRSEEEIIERIRIQSQVQTEAIIKDLKAKHEQSELKLRQKLMEYEYWIVEADRLHYSVFQAIAKSPVKEKFIEFKRIAEEVNSTIEEEMGLWQVNRGGSFISQSMINAPKDSDKHLRHQKRVMLESKVQMFEEIIQEFIPIF